MIQAMERAAIAPAFAASAVCAIPVMSSATNSGTTVMRSAFSHKVPIRSAMSAAPPAKSGNAAAAKIPSAMPTARARRMRAALDILALSERTSYQPLPDMPLDGKRKYMSEQEQMARQFFGTDGIRGLTNTMPMTAAMAQKVGQAAGAHFMRGNHRHRVVVGKDTRLSGYMMESALISGFTSVGMDVVMVGPMPTPAVAMLARSMRADLGVMISASHNPFADNGIKLFGPDGYKLTDDDEAAIEALLDEEPKLAPPREIGRARKIEDARGRYIHAAKLTFPEHLRLDGVKVVVDCANGAAYQVAPAALWELGADVVAIGVSPNGFNINDGCGSTDTRLLQQKVVEESADIGIALDGDADRLIVVDETGRVVDGDQLMALIAHGWKRHGLLHGGGIVATVMSNLGLERFLSSQGLTLERTKVGDRYVLEAMRAKGFNVGGEQSGHIILSDYATTGDGLVAALRCWPSWW
jgi:phosphoglucosamine mutase